MDLTPPALTYSPSPSQREGSSPSSFNSPQPDTVVSSSTIKPTSYTNSAYPFSLSYEPISPSKSIYPSHISDPFESPAHYLQLGSMSQPSWSATSPLLSSSAATPATSTVEHGLAADHGPFANYNSSMSHSYSRGNTYHHPGNSGPSSMAQNLSSSPGIESFRPSLNYSTAGEMKYHSPRIPSHYHLATTSYSAANQVHSVYTSEATATMHTASHDIRLPDPENTGWKLATNGLYPPFRALPVQPSSGEGSSTKTQLSSRSQDKTKRHHTKKEEANFQCQVSGCGKFFSRSYNFKSHMETHDEKREYPFQCEEIDCNKRFVRKTDLQRHHQSVHAKVRNHRCDYCGRMFARKDTLRRHMEDGCPKRFDIGPLAMPADHYNSSDIGRSNLTNNIDNHFGSDSRTGDRAHSRNSRSSFASAQSLISLPAISLSSGPSSSRRGLSDSND